MGSLVREFAYDENDESALIKELTLQVRKVIGPFAAPKKIFVVNDLPKTRSGKVRPPRPTTIYHLLSLMLIMLPPLVL
jgi:hypothetical protein